MDRRLGQSLPWPDRLYVDLFILSERGGVHAGRFRESFDLAERNEIDAVQMRLRRISACQVIGEFLLRVDVDERLIAVTGRRHNLAKPALLAANLELRPAVALGDPKIAGAVRQPAGNFLAQVDPGRVAL